MLGLQTISASRFVAAIANRVLVVEDDPVNAFVVAEMLNALGYAAEVAHDGAQGLRKATSERFCLIFMDVEMPVLDGLAATARIREAEAMAGQSACPVVAMTGHGTAGIMQLCRRAGMTGYLHKPFGVDALRHAVEEAGV